MSDGLTFWAEGAWRDMDADLADVQRRKEKLVKAYDWMEFFFLLSVLFAAGCVLAGVPMAPSVITYLFGWPDALVPILGGGLLLATVACGCLVLYRYQAAACKFYGPVRGAALTVMALVSMVGLFMLPRLLDSEVNQAVRGEGSAPRPPPLPHAQ